MNYYIFINNQSIGPMTVQQMMAYPVTPETPVSINGNDWRPLYAYPDLMGWLQSSGRSTVINQEVQSKKTLCGIMAILLGSLGIQYFILNKVGGGFLTILLSLVTCGMWSFITLVQGILMLCMSNDEFKRKYMDSTSVLPLF